MQIGKKSTDGWEQSSRASRTGDQSRFFGTKTKKKIQNKKKKIFSRYPLLRLTFSNGIPVPVCLCLRVSFLPSSLPLLSSPLLSLLSLSSLPSPLLSLPSLSSLSGMVFSPQFLTRIKPVFYSFVIPELSIYYL